MLIFVGGFGYAVYFGHMLGSVGLTDGQIMLVKKSNDDDERGSKYK